VSKRKKSRCSLVSRLVSNPLTFELGLGALGILIFVLYQETPPGTWALIKRILGRW